MEGQEQEKSILAWVDYMVQSSSIRSYNIVVCLDPSYNWMSAINLGCSCWTGSGYNIFTDVYFDFKFSILLQLI